MSSKMMELSIFALFILTVHAQTISDQQLTGNQVIQRPIADVQPDFKATKTEDSSVTTEAFQNDTSSVDNHASQILQPTNDTSNIAPVLPEQNVGHLNESESDIRTSTQSRPPDSRELSANTATNELTPLNKTISSNSAKNSSESLINPSDKGSREQQQQSTQIINLDSRRSFEKDRQESESIQTSSNNIPAINSITDHIESVTAENKIERHEQDHSLGDIQSISTLKAPKQVEEDADGQRTHADFHSPTGLIDKDAFHKESSMQESTKTISTLKSLDRAEQDDKKLLSDSAEESSIEKILRNSSLKSTPDTPIFNASQPFNANPRIESRERSFTETRPDNMSKSATTGDTSDEIENQVTKQSVQRVISKSATQSMTHKNSNEKFQDRVHDKFVVLICNMLALCIYDEADVKDQLKLTNVSNTFADFIESELQTRFNGEIPTADVDQSILLDEIIDKTVQHFKKVRQWTGECKADKQQLSKIPGCEAAFSNSVDVSANNETESEFDDEESTTVRRIESTTPKFQEESKEAMANERKASRSSHFKRPDEIDTDDESIPLRVATETQHLTFAKSTTIDNSRATLVRSREQNSVKSTVRGADDSEEEEEEDKIIGAKSSTSTARSFDQHSLKSSTTKNDERDNEDITTNTKLTTARSEPLPPIDKTGKSTENGSTLSHFINPGLTSTKFERVTSGEQIVEELEDKGVHLSPANRVTEVNPDQIRTHVITRRPIAFNTAGEINTSELGLSPSASIKESANEAESSAVNFFERPTPKIESNAPSPSPSIKESTNEAESSAVNFFERPTPKIESNAPSPSASIKESTNEVESSAVNFFERPTPKIGSNAPSPSASITESTNVVESSSVNFFERPTPKIESNASTVNFFEGPTPKIESNAAGSETMPSESNLFKSSQTSSSRKEDERIKETSDAGLLLFSTTEQTIRTRSEISDKSTTEISTERILEARIETEKGTAATNSTNSIFRTKTEFASNEKTNDRSTTNRQGDNTEENVGSTRDNAEKEEGRTNPIFSSARESTGHWSVSTESEPRREMPLTSPNLFTTQPAVNIQSDTPTFIESAPGVTSTHLDKEESPRTTEINRTHKMTDLQTTMKITEAKSREGNTVPEAEPSVRQSSTTLRSSFAEPEPTSVTKQSEPEPLSSTESTMPIQHEETEFSLSPSLITQVATEFLDLGWSLRFTDVDWSEDLRDNSSSKFQNLRGQIEPELTRIFEDLLKDKFIQLKIKRFSKGSAVADGDISVVNDKVSDIRELEKEFEGLVNKRNYKIAGLNVDPNKISLHKSGTDLQYDKESKDVKNTTPGPVPAASGAFPGYAIGILVGLIILAVLTIGGIIYMKRFRNRHSEYIQNGSSAAGKMPRRAAYGDRAYQPPPQGYSGPAAYEMTGTQPGQAGGPHNSYANQAYQRDQQRANGHNRASYNNPSSKV